jgi:hypothetical protein
MRNRKHRDRHTRPYPCTHSSCNGKGFGDKGTLARHQREVHGSQTYTCPVLSCPRNKQGFSRKYNLWEHKRRRHRFKPFSKQPRAQTTTATSSASTIANIHASPPCIALTPSATEHISEGDDGIIQTLQLREEHDFSNLSSEDNTDDNYINGSPSSALAYPITDDEGKAGEHSLRSKLEDLLSIRAEVDEDIFMFQRVLGVMNSEYE